MEHTTASVRTVRVPRHHIPETVAPNLDGLCPTEEAVGRLHRGEAPPFTQSLNL